MHDSRVVPAVSVVTPAYNSDSTLERAYRSLALQSLTTWEHIIVDDGSVDTTLNVATSIALEDCRVRVLSRSNGGPGAALNNGIAAARAPFIAFLDADDCYLPEHLEAHMERMAAEPHVDVLWGGVDIVCKNPEDAYVPDVATGAGYVHASECVVQGTLFVRRSVFDQVAFTEDRRIWYQDFDFVRRAALLFAVEQFHRATYRYYRVSSSSVVSLAKTHWPETPPRAKSARAG